MLRTVLAALMICVVSFVGTVDAQVACGDNITDIRTMTSDLVCPAHNPALTVTGGTLDMAGHTLSGCPSIGVSLAGTGSQLKNGTIQGCHDAVSIGGTGKHVILNIVAKDNSGDGFAAGAGVSALRIAHCSAINNSFGFQLSSAGDKNKLIGLTAVDNEFEGFAIHSDNNSLSDCVAINNDGGFEIFGRANKLTRCRAVSNRLEGFWIDSFGGHKLSECVAVNNQEAGFCIESDNNKLKRNIASGNTSYGFLFAGDENLSLKDIATRNGSGFGVGGDGNTVNGSSATGNTFDGFSLGGTGNTIKASHASSNDGTGISISGSSGKATKNVSLSNGEDDIDGNCDETLFSSNVFGSSGDPCIK